MSKSEINASHCTHKSDILLSFYNAERTIGKCIESITPYLTRERKLLIYNDGSSDKSAEIAKKILDRVCHEVYVYIDMPQNRGLTYALNYMLKRSTAELIFRIDSDDEVLPRRFELQETYMQKHKNVVVIGSQGRYKKTGCDSNKPLTYKQIRKEMHKNPVIHPSVCFRRREILKIGGYDESFISGQDHNLWYRCIRNDLIIENLPYSLIEIGPTYGWKYRPKSIIKEFIGCFVAEEGERNREGARAYLITRLVVFLPMSLIYSSLKRLRKISKEDTLIKA